MSRSVSCAAIVAAMYPLLLSVWAHAQPAEPAKPQPAYSGLLVTCAEYRKGTWGIYTLDDNGQLKSVVNGGMWPHYAPDRRSLVYVRGGNLWLHQMDSGANLASPWADHGCLCRWDLSWHPDGTRIYFIRGVPSDTEAMVDPLRVYTMKAEGFGSERPAFDVSKLITTEGDDHGYPVVSRSGRLAFCALRRHTDVGISRSHVYLEDPPGSKRYHRITDWLDATVETKPCWSPDGKTLAFEALDLTTGVRQVWRYDLQGRKLQRVLDQIPGADADRELTDCWLYGWQPGGDGLLLGFGCAGRDVPDVSGLIVARPDGNLVLMPHSGSNENVLDAAWSPDGQRVAAILSQDGPGQTAFLNCAIRLLHLSDPHKWDQPYATPSNIMEDFNHRSALTPVSLEW